MSQWGQLTEPKWQRLLNDDPYERRQWIVPACHVAFHVTGIGTSGELLELAQDAAVREQDFEKAAAIVKLTKGTA
ncbi:MAG: hypothetical protein H8E37_14345 [Planctomycetes bacterium]|nr:hypothetical protein [Planctomycetota bacterium]